ncbi:BTB/POZ domain-containing protein 7 [Anopheles aquasalis]|uniref:BTB/POZ domain-containing protein 7 n=1 Tax=Anopheles aquasalis TaxID=42839 RepID=UPI00215AE3E3|nr:BTB/POZ domain-containing protein 7 [Anopheles aquasalis]XP_050084336.1 BTB/POZ domain-containing protein 7 [Anopheles aquasalis]XP_050084337.1 BTB/POZ domain-containing protein 7 [Anopheles aquasalis]XP_050084338.1 BTB/POZ domain-containing protein 7 [Anopheles aquasalis]
MNPGLWGCLIPCGLSYWCESKSGGGDHPPCITTEMGATASTDCPGSSVGGVGGAAAAGGGGGGGGGGGSGAMLGLSGITSTAATGGVGTTTTPLSSSSGLLGYGPMCGPGSSNILGAAPGGGAVVRERRKKVTGFATLKKKLIRRRRSSKACDHGRVLREFVSSWSPIELSALLEEYESLAALKDLSVQAELARPPATTFKQDLASLYDYKHCTDCDLVFRGTVFPVHRAILSARCSYFRDLLAGCPGYGARICLELRSSPVDVAMFSSLLRYLYTGDLCTHDPNIDVSLLRRLGEDFGTPNPLENDLRYLLETGDYADAAIVFTSEGGDYHRPDSGSSEYGFRPKLELPCHKAILSARSPFFKSMIQRRTRNVSEEHQLHGTDRSLHATTRIVLDESVIPKRYARVLLHAIYLDTVDLSLILRGSGCGSGAGSLGEVQALTHTGRARPSPLEEAMELYQIGRFLELDILAQGCEDLILEWLSLDTLATVLRWGSQPHGSAWVYRQACHYLREEFSAIVGSPVLFQLDKSQLIEALQNNFLQASELEVLQAVLKWGEQELIRRMEDREPNLLSHTAHSVTRKGIKKRDLSDVELREILSELLPHVRMDHVLPPNNEILNQAIRRGLVSTPPSHMIGDERESLRINAWIRGGKNHGLFVRPRLFMPYYEEVKVLLEDHAASQQIELLRMRRARHAMPDIPDTLYMVSRLNSSSGATLGGGSAAGVDVVAATAASIPAPDTATMESMQKREQKLRQAPGCQRALGLTLSSRSEINRQIRLRVVREFNFPDEVAELLECANCYCADGDGNGGEEHKVSHEYDQDDHHRHHHHHHHHHHTHHTANRQQQQQQQHHQQQQQQHHRHHDMHASRQSLDDDSTPPPSPALLAGELGQAGSIPCFGRNMTFPRQQPGTASSSTYPAQPQHQQHHPLPQHALLSHGNAVAGGGLLHSAMSNPLGLLGTHRRQELPSVIPGGDIVAYRLSAPAGGGGQPGVGGGGGVGLDLGEIGACSDGHLSDVMPDVAMATASLGQLHLGGGSSAGNAGNGDGGGGGRGGNSNPDVPESLHLDLGDGPSHMIGAASGISGLHHNTSQHHRLTPASATSTFHHYMTRNLHLNLNPLAHPSSSSSQQAAQHPSSSHQLSASGAGSSAASSSSLLLAHGGAPTVHGSQASLSLSSASQQQHLGSSQQLLNVATSSSTQQQQQQQQQQPAASSSSSLAQRSSSPYTLHRASPGLPHSSYHSGPPRFL